MGEDVVSTTAGTTRRGFLQQLEAGAIAAACGRGAAQGLLPMLLTACGGARYARTSLVGTRLTIDRVEVGPQGALVDPPDGGLPIHVRPLGDGRFAALSTRCMHRGCQVEPATDRYVCPCHGSEYTFEGAVLKGPTERPLLRYRVSTDDARVYVHLDALVDPERGS